MAQVQKTPVMVLQELSTKLGISPPVYELITELTKQGTHKNEFFYEVQAFQRIARGTGSSKQIAKHDAAKRMLQQLQDANIYHPAENPVHGFVPGSAKLNNQPIKTSVNCIGTLCELCEENDIPQPQFEEILDVGPPHCRQFTYDCIVNSIRTRATASTKKQARQLAAKDMLEKIKDILPELTQECNLTAKQITENDNAAIDTFLDLSTTIMRKPDYCCKIKEYDMIFKKIMKEKGITWDDLKDDISEEYREENFNNILEKLELYKNFVPLSSRTSEAIIILSLSISAPSFATIGQGKNEDEAKYEASRDAYYKMLSWMK